MQLGRSAVIVLVLSVVALYLIVPAHASARTIIVSDPAYSSQVILGNAVNVGFTVSWSGIPTISNTPGGGAYFITAGVIDSSHDSWVDGAKVGSNPGVCQDNTGFYIQPNWAACTIPHLGTDGYAAVDFSLDVTQVGRYSYKVAAQLFHYSYLCVAVPSSAILVAPYSESNAHICGDEHAESSTFTITVIDTFTLTVNVPNSVPVTLDGVQQGAGSISLPLRPHTHAISVPGIVELDSSSRLKFTGWSDGSTELIKTFDLENDTEMIASYATQYYVSATSESTLGSNWYDTGTVVSFSVNQTQLWNSYRAAVGGFDGWYSNGRLISKSETASFAVAGPVKLTAEWNNLPYIPPIMIIILGTLAVARDVSDRRRMSAELLKSKRLAVVGEAAAMVGHDLRNPLQATTMRLYLAKKLLGSERVEDRNEALGLLDDMDGEIHYMDKIVSDLQDYARPMGDEPSETNLPDLIKEAISSVKIPQNINVSSTVEGDSPRVIVTPLMLRRVLVNLILNAVQAMPNGGELAIVANTTPNSISITVQDTGVGIPPENLEKIFNPFFTTKAQGQGLGLAVCKRLVEAQRGEIAVKSAVGKGSTFTVHLPTRGATREN